MYSPAPCSRQSCRKAAFVTPAIGANTTGVSMTSASLLDGELSRKAGSSRLGVDWIVLIASRLGRPRSQAG